DVDSIRIFDPESQLSERKLSQVSIIPNIETQFDSAEKISLMDFLPANTIVWVQDWEITRDRLLTQEEDLHLFLDLRSTAPKAEEEENLDVMEAQPSDFTTTSNIEQKLEDRHVVEFGFRSTFNAGLQTEIGFHTKQQPAFNRQFDILIKDLRSWEAKKFQVYLFAENPRQLERLHSIFEDLKAEIHFTPLPTAIHEGFIDEDLKVVCYTDHQIFQRYHKYKVKQAYNKNKAITLRTLRELQPGDYVTHIDHGVGIYSGLQKIEMNGKMQESVRIIYKDSDILYVNIHSLHKIAKYTGKEGTVPRVNKLGSDAWQKLKEKTKTRVKELAFDLIKLYAARKAQQGFKHS
ncbi:MAG TPA: CarD family transcriptional regulator, partial [Chitinophagaceae bacterium]|nr:CarD family transcriptional regulator [Chitinophagaceae bacterium]